MIARGLSVLRDPEFWRGYRCGIAVFVVLVAALAQLAPVGDHTNVPASSVPIAPITGNPCGTLATVRSAVLVEDLDTPTAARTYRVTCSTGVITTYTAP